MAAQTYISSAPHSSKSGETSLSIHNWLDSSEHQSYKPNAAQMSSQSLEVPILNRPRAYSAVSSTQTDSHKTSPLSSSSNASTSSQSRESYASGKFHGRGLFKPAGNAQYNFIVERFKHRKEVKAEKAEERPQLTAKNLKKLG